MSLLARLAARFERAPRDEQPASRAAAVRLATAALLVEAIRADFEVRDDERAALPGLLERQFGLTNAEASALVADAEHAADRSISLYDFTRVLNDTLAPGEKLDVIELLWRVSLADGQLDRYEDHLIRKLADLLYVPAADVLRLRNRVRDERA